MTFGNGKKSAVFSLERFKTLAGKLALPVQSDRQDHPDIPAQMANVQPLNTHPVGVEKIGCLIV